MDIKHLDWDSHHFQLKIGKVEYSTLNSSQYDDLILQKKNLNFDRIYLFLNEPLPESLSSVPFLADTKIMYHKTMESYTYCLNSQVEIYQGLINDNILNLAISSGHKSRFKTDALLAPGFESLYKTWIEKSISHEIADAVFTFAIHNIIEGFVTVKINNNIGTIGLIAVSENHKGMGIGRELMEKAQQWVFSQGICDIEVATQSANTEACRFYEKLGYQIKNINYIYHL